MDRSSAASGYILLLLARARANLELGHHVDAQVDLREVIRLEPTCGAAYRLLGEIAVQRDHRTAAATFFREAVRLEPNRDAARLFAQPARLARGSASSPRSPSYRTGSRVERDRRTRRGSVGTACSTSSARVASRPCIVPRC